MKMISILVGLLLIPGVIMANNLAVTVYNSNLGVVSETRSLDFTKGIGRLAFRDVPSAIDASSVTFEIIGQQRNVSILEQNYAYDLVSPEQIYSRYIDKPIELVDKDGKLYSGTLLAYNSGAITLRDSKGGIKIVQLGNIAEVNFPSLPDGLITRPTLFWRYQSDYDGKLDCKVGYQTSGLTWSAEYVGILSKNDDNLNLSGWASINNTSGKTYTDATLKLIAGDINRSSRQPRFAAKTLAVMEDAAAGFEEKAFFEYHMYTLPRKATLANKEIKQITLFEPASTSVEKQFIYRPDRNPTQVEVAIKFTNSAKAGLGMPLPAGRVRLFKTDDDGSLILLGEDNIQHTPRDEKISLKVGYAFDIKAKENMIKREKISQRVEDREFEIELRNRKDSPVTIQIEKKLWGYWEVLDANFPYEIKDAETLQFAIPVGARETATVRYKVRFTRQ